jgi:hypothetical protein
MLVGRQFPTVCQRLAFIRDPLAFIRQALAPGGCRLALVRQALAPQGEPLTLSGKLLSLLGDVLAVGSNSSAFPSHPDHLVRRLRRLSRFGWVRSNFFGSVSVCMHPDGRLRDGAQAYLAGSSPECSLVPPRGVDSAANCDRLRREPITLEGPA